MSNNITRASHEWATRPDDQRYTSLADLKTAVLQRKRESWTATPSTGNLRVLPSEDGEIGLQVYDGTKGENRILSPTNWSFNQLAQYAGAPAAYLRKLPAQLTAINLQWGLEQSPLRDDSLILAQSNGTNQLRAMTSTSYGRIWDHEVVEAVERVNHEGRWQIPAASYATTNPKRATTLYASDRDVFIFLVDPKNPIEVNGEQLFRGFYTWNSEVGSATFGLTTFLYRFVCDNRIIWGATDVKELRIRHTGGAPERFAYEGERYLRRYADESTGKLVEGIKAAQSAEIPVNKGKDETVQDWLQSRGFTKAQAKASVDAAVAEEGQARTVWQVVNGITPTAPAPRVDIPEMLPATTSNVYGATRVDTAPFAQVGTAGDPAAEAAARTLRDSIARRGFDPWDVYGPNIGQVGGQWKVIDPGAVLPPSQTAGLR